MAVAFTKRYIDKSLPVGYRFQFYCDRVGNYSIDLKEPTLVKTTNRCTYSFLSTFQPNAAAAVAKLAQAANIFIKSAQKDNLAAAGQAFSMVTKDKHWEQAFEKAVDEAKPNFRECKLCRRWVCVQNCFNAEADQCIGCLTGSPTTEITLSKAHQFFSKVWQNVQSVAADVQKTAAGEISIEKRILNVCPHCEQDGGTGKFCGMCGGNMEIAKQSIFCAHCGDQIEINSDLKFCPNCGDSLAYLSAEPEPPAAE